MRALQYLFVFGWTAFIVTACVATTPASDPVTAQQATIVKVECLPLKAYTLAEQKAVAAELQKLPDTDPLAGFIKDYGAMRAADRACQSK